MASLDPGAQKPKRIVEGNAGMDARLNVGRPDPLKASPLIGARPPEPIRILIVDDHPLVRDGLRALLTPHPEFRVIGEAADGDEALRLAIELQPDVMLLDFSMPRKSGLEVMRELNGGLPRVRTILMTAGVEKLDMVRMLQQGVKGLVLKGSPTELLFKCIRKVHRGELWIGRETMTDLVDLLSMAEDHASRGQRDFGLTPREREIIRLIVEGETNKAIAQRLSIGEDTVKHHLTSSFNKTGTSSRLELALFARDHGLT
jgi:two-component system, NarL family, nitrate/nitrite response regulator NarL